MRISPRPIFLHSLIRSAYLPEEIPPAITSKNFAEFCKNEYQHLIADNILRNKTVTQFDTFTAPVAAKGRRNFALVHPLSQLRFSLLITEHRVAIRRIISGSGISLYLTDESPKDHRAFSGLHFESWGPRRQHIYSECHFILKADISRFFHTIYTHSIPWAVLGKSKTKHMLQHDRKSLEKHWSHKLDMALQACQSRETFGIPVGPDTSRIVAEILLAGVESDEKLVDLIVSQPSCRLVDDYTIGFNEESSARSALSALRDALWGFNLQLNEEKTTIASARDPIDERWKHEFLSLRVADRNSKTQESDIYRLVDMTLHFCANANSGQPATFACRRIARLSRIERNFGIIVDALFRLSREFPSCISHVAEFLINNQSLCDDTKIKTRIKRWVTATIQTHLSHGHDYEVAWALVISGVLRIPVDKEVMELFDRVPNSVVFAVLGMLHERGLLLFPLSNWPWRAQFRRSGLYGEHWLPFYEAVLRNWTKDKKIVSAVKSHPIFSKMLAQRVTFLEDKILDAAKISVSRRVFTKSVSRKKSRGDRISWGTVHISAVNY